MRTLLYTHHNGRFVRERTLGRTHVADTSSMYIVLTYNIPVHKYPNIYVFTDLYFMNESVCIIICRTGQVILDFACKIIRIYFVFA